MRRSSMRAPPPTVLAPVRRLPLATPTLRLLRVRIRGAPSYDRGGGCDPYFLLKRTVLIPRDDFGEREAKHAKIVRETRTSQRTSRLYDSRASWGVLHADHGGTVEWDCSEDPEPLLLRGDIKFTFFDRDSLSKDDHMFHLWLHTRHLAPHASFVRTELDKANKKKNKDRYPADFSLEIETEPFEAAAEEGGAQRDARGDSSGDEGGSVDDTPEEGEEGEEGQEENNANEEEEDDDDDTDSEPDEPARANTVSPNTTPRSRVSTRL